MRVLTTSSFAFSVSGPHPVLRSLPHSISSTKSVCSDSTHLLCRSEHPLGVQCSFQLGPTFLDTSNTSEMHSETLRSLESHPILISALAIDNRECVMHPWSNHGQTPCDPLFP